MNHHERRQSQREGRQPSAIQGSRSLATVHCRMVNQHIPVVEALKLHTPGSSNCFSCGRTGDECKHLSGSGR